jgi:hypothetical protein
MLTKITDLRPMDVFTLPTGKSGAMIYISPTKYMGLNDGQLHLILALTGYDYRSLDLLEVEVVGKMEFKSI